MTEPTPPQPPEAYEGPAMPRPLCPFRKWEHTCPYPQVCAKQQSCIDGCQSQ